MTILLSVVAAAVDHVMAAVVAVAAIWRQARWQLYPEQTTQLQLAAAALGIQIPVPLALEWPEAIVPFLVLQPLEAALAAAMGLVLLVGLVAAQVMLVPVDRERRAKAIQVVDLKILQAAAAEVLDQQVRAHPLHLSRAMAALA